MAIRPTTPIERDPARLEEVLPWYLNGTLAEEDRAWVEQILADDGDGDDARRTAHRGEHAFDRHLAQAFQDRLAEIPADIGWSRLLQCVRTDAMPAAAISPSPAVTAGPNAGGSGDRTWWQRLTNSNL